MRSLKGALLTR
jgi:protein Mpv17